MKPVSLNPLDRPAYQPSLQQRLAEQRATAAEPKLRGNASAVSARGRWEYLDDPTRFQ